MAVDAKLVKELREKTGAGILDSKKALEEANNDLNKAIELLREKGLAAAANKAGRIATEGVVESYIHAGGRIGVLVEINCETDVITSYSIHYTKLYENQFPQRKYPASPEISQDSRGVRAPHRGVETGH